MAKRKSLGRGLDALLSSTASATPASATDSLQEGGDETHFCFDVGVVGVYEVETLESGNLKFTLVDDPCSIRLDDLVVPVRISAYHEDAGSLGPGNHQ